MLRSLKPFPLESVARDVVRGQYRAGNAEGQAAIGYLEEDKVPAGSATETFVALRTEVQNWRWAGVPFYLRTGKRLAERDAQIVVNFRPTPHNIFPGVNRPNKLVIKLQPEDGLELHLLAAKGAGQSRGAGAGVARPRLRQGVRREPGRRLRAAAARRHRRPAQPVRAQRRAGGGVALGRAGARRLAPRRHAACVPTPPAPGARRRRARWSRATASPGRKKSSARS